MDLLLASTELEHHERALRLAIQDRQSVAQQRTDWWLKAWDAVVPTEEHEEENQARASLDQAKDRIRQALAAWIVNESNRLLHQSEGMDDDLLLEEHEQKSDALQQTIAVLVDQAKTTVYQLQLALEYLTKAKQHEQVEMVFDNAVARMISAQFSEASREKIRQAGESMEILRVGMNLLPNPLADEFWFQESPLVLKDAWTDIGKIKALGKAKDDCHLALDSVLKIYHALREEHPRVIEEVYQAQDRRRALRQPFVNHLKANLPANLRALINQT